MYGLMPYASRRMNVYNPFAELTRDFWSAPMGELKTDITDTGESYKLEADLPGFKKEDIKLDLNDDCLTISAERKSESEEKDKSGFVRRERTYGSFTRSFDVSGIDASAITASYADGVLTLDLPKKPELKPEVRRIEIQ